MYFLYVKMLTGTLLDPSGRPLPNKRVVIRLADGSTRTLFTDSRGVYTVYNIKPGNVEVDVGGQKSTTAVSPSKITSLTIKLTK